MCVLALCLLAGLAQGGNDGRAAFAEGVEAARADDHEDAVAAFEQARVAGLDTPALDFNLGVSLYRTGRIEAAEDAFRRAYRSPRMAGPAAYNLGRIARGRGDLDTAADWFREAGRVARTDALRERAWAALDALDEPVSRLYALVGFGAGYDSNATQMPDDLAGRARESDLFLAYEAFAHYRLDGGFYLLGSLTGEAYRDVAEIDLLAVRAGAGWREAPATWRRDARVMLRERHLDGTVFERALLTDIGTTRTVGDGNLRVGLGADALEGRSGFRFLDGYRLRAGSRWRFPATGGRWTLRARLEHIDREDDELPGFFASYSRTGGGLSLDHRRHIGAGRFLRIDAGWTGLRYADAEVRQGETLGRRRESLWTAGAEVEWPLAPRWQLITRLDGTRRSSSIERFEYDQIRLLATFEREF